MPLVSNFVHQFFMKQVSVALLLLTLVFMTASPAAVFARGGDDDGDRTELSSSDDGDDTEDDSDSDDSDADESGDALEVEADVFTDTTIVKVELPSGAKSRFSTDADTEEEVAAVVADKFSLTVDEILAVIDFEVENRMSRSGDRINLKDRIKMNDRVKDRIKDRIKECRDNTSGELEVEADVFTDTTIVKVELASGTKKVFDTEATTSADIVAEVADRYDLDADDVEAVLDLETENRASRAADRAIANNPADCDDDNSNVGGNHGTSTPTVRDAELKARIAELQRLLDTLIKLFTARFGTSI